MWIVNKSIVNFVVGCGSGGRAIALLSEGCWFNSPCLHTEVSCGMILNPKQLLMCMAATAISVWIAVSRFGQKHLLNALNSKRTFLFKIKTLCKENATQLNQSQSKYFFNISVRGDLMTYFQNGMHKNTSSNRNVWYTLRKKVQTLSESTPADNIICNQAPHQAPSNHMCCLIGQANIQALCLGQKYEWFGGTESDRGTRTCGIIHVVCVCVIVELFSGHTENV